MHRQFVVLAGWMLVFLLAGCTSSPTPGPGSTVTNAPTASLPSSVEVSTPPESSPSPTSIQRTEETLAPAGSEEVSALCSPLEGIALENLNTPDLLKTPFQAPPPGDDGGHFGVDFAYWTSPEGKPMLGLPVNAILDGKVAGIIQNRKPYGNTIILETPLENLPKEIRERLPGLNAQTVPTPIPPRSLSCPSIPFQGNFSSLSLYHLYAHLNKPPSLTLGESVNCGTEIGEVGSTGNSVNAHLHLETRLGPSGVTFPRLAHYDNSATPEEMGWYCLWRISGFFQAFDPMILFP